MLIPADVFRMQRLINSGTCWILEGSIGRAAADALRSGQCVLPLRRHRDAYGAPVPSRKDVKPGTMGSYALVRERMGESYARSLIAVR